MKKEIFGRIQDRDIYLYTLENSHGMRVVVSNFGALIIRLYAPDREGRTEDVALGYDTLKEYQANGNFYGAVIAPNCNRIGGAQFTLGSVTCRLDANDGENNLHSHRELGAHKRIWDAAEKDGGIQFTMQMKDGELGFPGNKKFSVLYEVTEDDGLKITYDAQSDCDTVINMTNHCYFNLNGHGAGAITGHTLQLFASSYTPTHPGSIPTGEIAPVAGTPMDFRTPHVIGERIDREFEQLRFAGGYDHNWVCDGYDGTVRKIASVTGDDASRTMEVYTDLPGVQFYAGNFMEPERGKDGCSYDYRGGFALETQYYPDTPNRPEFPSSVFGPEKPYHTTTLYRFV